MILSSGVSSRQAGWLFAGVLYLCAVFMIYSSVFAVDISSSVVVTNAGPTVSAVSLNGGSSVVLTANATTAVNVNFTVSDNNGCGDVFYSGNVTTTAYRTALTSACSASNLNCYVSVATTTNSCPFATSSQVSANATITLGIYYFAQATDASSTFSSDSWTATVAAKDSMNATSAASSATSSLLTLNAINVTTSSINYGSLVASSTTGGTNSTTTVANAGNSSSTLRLAASSTLGSGGFFLATSSQHYATSGFTYGGAEQVLTGSLATVSGLSLTAPTSTSNVTSTVFWGLSVAGGTPTGTYSGTNLFSALWVQ